MTRRDEADAARVPADQAARDRVVAERGRNVVVIAGAGTGKTKTIIDRAVELLAPASAGVAALSIQRVAAITFTRRAAGELRFRLRERLLREIETAAASAPHRVEPLRAALGSLDAAFIGTIHGFADRLLRLRPVEAALSPSYALVEDTDELVRETQSRLRRGAELGTLGDDLGGFGADLPAGLVEEAGATLRAAVESGVQLERAQAAWGPLPSVEETIARMIETRDVVIPLPPEPDPALAEAAAAAHKFAENVGRCRGGSSGVAQLRRIARALRPLASVESAPAAIRTVADALRGRLLYKGRDFNDDAVAWGVYGTIHPEKPRGAWILAQLQGPHRWLATRLVRLAPVACAMYERVKAEHEVVDYLDLLIKLRRLLRDDLEARAFYQGLFDHLFVDEFQDTDPLQCEIVFYLAGAAGGRREAAWDVLPLESGKLTIVGDPKQSIYRFRRADIAMYSRAVDRLVAEGAHYERLETNFRSRASLIEFFNAQLAGLLGRSSEAFDPAVGRAAYEDLVAAVPPSSQPAVDVVRYRGAGGADLLAPQGRAIEAAALARHVRGLLDRGTVVRDVEDGRERPLRPGDIAVLACVTSQLPLLLREFDAVDVPYTARGGTLFVGHPLVRRFLLALRALADRHDGVAEAALLQPPFFALDLEDHVAAQIFKKPEQDERRARVEAAREIVAKLRQRRHAQSPGATARDLIEATALGRLVATTPNGAQTLAALYEVAQEADRRAALDGLDFDTVSETFRRWASAPTFLETPEPIGDAAVRVMTIHGAKGLEFPVVVLWDGFQILAERRTSTWQVERDGRAWALSLGAVAVEYPQAGIVARERSFAAEERRRLYYVAATRARDRLVVPLPSPKGRWEYATAALLDGVDAGRVQILPPFQPDVTPAWAQVPIVSAPTVPEVDASLDREFSEARSRFRERLRTAADTARPPVAVTALAAGAAVAREDEGVDSVRRAKAGGARLGAAFGLVVHRAIELSLAFGHDVATAVGLAAREYGAGEALDEALADVERAHASLRAAGLLDAGAFAVEYPLAGLAEGRLAAGFIDFLHVDDDRISVVDFKTDKPRGSTVAQGYRAYARQLEIYGDLLGGAGVVGHRALRLGLLLTATGELRWHAPASPRA